MSSNNSQPAHSPSEVLITDNNDNAFNTDNLLSVQIITTNQPSSLQFNPINMIPNIQQHDHILTPCDVRRRQQHPEREEQPRLQDQHRRLQLLGIREREERSEEEYQQRMDFRYRHRHYRNPARVRYEYYQWRSTHMDELNEEEAIQNRLLDVYDLERMNPQDKQEIWEQQQLNDLEENSALQRQGSLNEHRRLSIQQQPDRQDELEQFNIQQEQQINNDYIEQSNQINTMENWDEAQREERNEEQLMQLDQW